MIIIQISGGIGNQLQQFSLYKKFQTLGKEVKLDLSWFENEDNEVTHRDFELDYLKDLQYDICTIEEKQRLLKKPSFIERCLRYLFPSLRKVYVEHSMYDPEILNFNDMYLEGYFACEMYYADIIPLLQEIIRFPIIKGSKNDIIAKKMKEQNSVSLHIRRGDYLNEQNARLFKNICTDDYYASAIEYILKKHPDAHFYLFSDDIDYLKDNFKGEQFTIVDWNIGKDSFFDMYLMSQCKDNICANSTFSFWGARLNGNLDKIMIRPLKQRNNMSYESKPMHELWKNWILIDADGKVV